MRTKSRGFGMRNEKKRKIKKPDMIFKIRNTNTSGNRESRRRRSATCLLLDSFNVVHVRPKDGIASSGIKK